MTTLLLVEDNALNRDMLSRRLERMGYDVLLAVDGQEGVDMTRAHNPAIVLMDINMPVMNGWQALTAIKNDPETADVPVVALTAYAMTSDRDKAGEIGFDAYASKPVDFPALVQMIEILLHTDATEND